MSKFEQDVFWKDGSEIEDQVVIPFRSFELNKFIETQRRKGDPNVNTFILVSYKRWALPVTAFVLTIIGVAVSSMKRRGGMGINLAFGILVAFMYIFLDKVFGTLAEQSGFPPLLAVSIPNLIFGVIGLYFLNAIFFTLFAHFRRSRHS